jgi:hypothetical protein
MKYGYARVSTEDQNPAKPNEYETCIVPAGPKARFVVGYANDYIQRHDTATVNMGETGCLLSRRSKPT